MKLIRQLLCLLIVATFNLSGVNSLSQGYASDPILPANPTESDLSIVVNKSQRTLSLISNWQLLKSYHIDIGDGGLDDKERRGDHKTPEGEFYITERLTIEPRDEFLGTRWFRLSYPNVEAAARGLASGLIDNATYEQIIDAISRGVTPPQNTPLGGGIGIHGGASSELGSDWTYGCIGMNDNDLEVFFDVIPLGTRVIIQK